MIELIERPIYILDNKLVLSSKPTKEAINFYNTLKKSVAKVFSNDTDTPITLNYKIDELIYLDIFIHKVNDHANIAVYFVNNNYNKMLPKFIKQKQHDEKLSFLINSINTIRDPLNVILGATQLLEFKHINNHNVDKSLLISSNNSIEINSLKILRNVNHILDVSGDSHMLRGKLTDIKIINDKLILSKYANDNSAIFYNELVDSIKQIESGIIHDNTITFKIDNCSYQTINIHIQGKDNYILLNWYYLNLSLKDLFSPSPTYNNSITYLADASHELRTPLNVLLGITQLSNLHLKKNNTEIDNSRINEYIQLTKFNSLRLLRLVNNLVELMMADSNIDTHSLNTCNINIDSQVNNGSTFTISLPTCKANIDSYYDHVDLHTAIQLELSDICISK